MSPSPGDGASPPQDSKVVGSIASVIKKLTKSAPTFAQSSRPSLVEANTGRPSTIPAGYALPPQYMALFEQLRGGTVNERVAAANALRVVVIDYPINPVR